LESRSSHAIRVRRDVAPEERRPRNHSIVDVGAGKAVIAIETETETETETEAWTRT